MKKILAFVAVALAVISCKNNGSNTQDTAEWAPAGDRIMTEWGENLDPANVLPEYPRPQMVREKWMNLNGLWDYKAINSDGKILVPFALESALSGVGERHEPDQQLIYERTVEIPTSWLKQHVLLNCGGIDCISEIIVNDEYVIKHKGGFTAISEDITEYLHKGENDIRIVVTDNTDESFHAIGKQRNNNSGIFYTPVTGIWQTIWLEPVPENHIKNLKITPYLDLSTLTVCANITGEAGEVEVEVYDGKTKVASGKGEANKDVNIKIAEPRLWSPEDPFLYDLRVVLKEGGKKVDEVKSYAAMRKVSVMKDGFGTLRIALNEKPIFSFGPLDQGWWPDGLYTAPTDEALEFDIRRTKELGYNTIRKHVKVEPDRWYYHCDRLGVMVWQDMPSGDYYCGSEWSNPTTFIEGEEPEIRSAESMAQYYKDWMGIIDQLYNHPCIIMWVPFNEAWGQSRTVEVVNRTKLADPTRIVNHASGGNHVNCCDDVMDFHNYSENPVPQTYPYPNHIVVMGEMGGLGLAIKDHTWEADGWGYRKIADGKALTDKYIEYVKIMINNVDNYGISGAIYTQTTDCETEINGIFTYDRKVMKFDEERFRAINEQMSHSLD